MNNRCFTTKIDAVDWGKRDWAMTPKRYALLQQYLSRTAKIAHEWSLERLFGFNDGQIVLAGKFPQKALVQSCEERYLSELAVNRVEKRVLRNAFIWSHLPGSETHDLLSPFDSMYDFFIDGGILFVDKSMLQFEGGMVPIGSMGEYLAQV